MYFYDTTEKHTNKYDSKGRPVIIDEGYSKTTYTYFKTVDLVKEQKVETSDSTSVTTYTYKRLSSL